MAELEAAFRSSGAGAVATYIQSGNVVFESDRAEDVCGKAGAATQRRLGFRPPIVLRSAEAWRAMIGGNPFVAAGAATDRLHVACLAALPDDDAPAQLAPQSFLPDEFVLAGADIYLRLPKGVAKSAITNALLDKSFGTVSTVRNWRTAMRLLEFLDGGRRSRGSI